VADNLSNSVETALKRVKEITGKSVSFYQIDIRDKAALTEVFNQHTIDAVIHMAGLKAVGESCAEPLKYYQNNLDASMILFEVMQSFLVNKVVFSSSATVYGDPDTVPITEDFPLRVMNPYGRTKYMVEEMLRDITAASDMRAVLLRYFNPIGAHESGLIGEDPHGIPNNLMPYIAQVAIGQREKLSVFGGDYPTTDGTGVRDYIHVVDLAKGHVKALEKIAETGTKQGQCLTYNLGTGRGSSVIEVINAFEKAYGDKINYEIVERRPGDVPEYFANPLLANEEMGWRAEKSLDDMMTDTWRWQSQNPNGYKDD
jgi:UDP-glucose 4-epimerase